MYVKNLITAFILLLAISYYFFGNEIIRFFYAPQEPPAGLSNNPAKNGDLLIGSDYEVVAENLKIPWEVAFLPGGDLLVTERTGTLLRLGKDKKTYRIEGVAHQGEGGLLGMALHPDFEQNNWIYLYLTTSSDGGLKNRVERYRFENDFLTDRRVIIDGIPGATYHDGGRMRFGPVSAPTSVGATAGKPDYYLFITTGDAGRSNLAQDKNSLAGKILRIKDNGEIPSDNPFGNLPAGQAGAVWSYGHRNPQGLAWDDKGQLWATEHGRSGILSGFDELNLIENGKNYGWPEIQGDERKDGMESPVLHSGSDYTWAPADIEFVRGSLFFGGLRGEALYEARSNRDGKPDLKIHFLGQFGRLRAVKLGPDGMLYITTSNTDGRGVPRAGDDKIIRIKLSTE